MIDNSGEEPRVININEISDAESDLKKMIQQ